MQYNEYRPCRHLQPYVECYWSARSEQPPFRDRENLIPDGTIELMFNFGDDYSQVLEKATRPVKGSHVIGIRRKALIISQTRRQNFFCIRFRPGGFYPLFRIPVHEFSGGFFQIEELLPEEFQTLEYRLFEADTDRTRVKITEHFLLQKMQAYIPDYRLVQAMSQTLMASPGLRVETLADQFNTNYKTIERKFLDVIGLTPVKLVNIKRFNLAVHTLYSGRFDSLVGVAYASGYYDQSHFIRQFKKLAGTTPRRFLEEQFTIVKVIQPALAERLSKSYNFS